MRKRTVSDKNPMQPLERDRRGVVRFKANEIVRRLLDENGTIDLNTIARWNVSQDDAVQFAQLIGYSLAGFHELSYVPDSACKRATRAAKRTGVVKERDAGGCRDVGCEIHRGVKEEDP